MAWRPMRYLIEGELYNIERRKVEAERAIDPGPLRHGFFACTMVPPQLERSLVNDSWQDSVNRRGFPDDRHFVIAVGSANKKHGVRLVKGARRVNCYSTSGAGMRYLTAASRPRFV